MKTATGSSIKLLIFTIAILGMIASSDINRSRISVMVHTRAESLTNTPQEESGAPHLPLASVGITLGQTARINVVNSPEPTSSARPEPMIVEMCFHDANGNLVLDRARRPVLKTATIDPHHGDSLDLNGNLVAGFA